VLVNEARTDLIAGDRSYVDLYASWDFVRQDLG
jgi:hypothetical protein